MREYVRNTVEWNLYEKVTLMSLNIAIYQFHIDIYYFPIEKKRGHTSVTTKDNGEKDL